MEEKSPKEKHGENLILLGMLIMIAASGVCIVAAYSFGILVLAVSIITYIIYWLKGLPRWLINACNLTVVVIGSAAIALHWGKYGPIYAIAVLLVWSIGWIINYRGAVATFC